MWDKIHCCFCKYINNIPNSTFIIKPWWNATFNVLYSVLRFYYICKSIYLRIELSSYTLLHFIQKLIVSYPLLLNRYMYPLLLESNSFQITYYYTIKYNPLALGLSNLHVI